MDTVSTTSNTNNNKNNNTDHTHHHGLNLDLSVKVLQILIEMAFLTERLSISDHARFSSTCKQLRFSTFQYKYHLQTIFLHALAHNLYRNQPDTAKLIISKSTFDLPNYPPIENTESRLTLKEISNVFFKKNYTFLDIFAMAATTGYIATTAWRSSTRLISRLGSSISSISTPRPAEPVYETQLDLSCDERLINASLQELATFLTSNHLRIQTFDALLTAHHALAYHNKVHQGKLMQCCSQLFSEACDAFDFDRIVILWKFVVRYQVDGKYLRYKVQVTTDQLKSFIKANRVDLMLWLVKTPLAHGHTDPLHIYGVISQVFAYSIRYGNLQFAEKLWSEYNVDPSCVNNNLLDFYHQHGIPVLMPGIRSPPPDPLPTVEYCCEILLFLMRIGGEKVMREHFFYETIIHVCKEGGSHIIAKVVEASGMDVEEFVKVCLGHSFSCRKISDRSLDNVIKIAADQKVPIFLQLLKRGNVDLTIGNNQIFQESLNHANTFAWVLGPSELSPNLEITRTIFTNLKSENNNGKFIYKSRLIFNVRDYLWNEMDPEYRDCFKRYDEYVDILLPAYLNGFLRRVLTVFDTRDAKDIVLEWNRRLPELVPGALKRVMESPEMKKDRYFLKNQQKYLVTLEENGIRVR
ncbi:hypothetical protein HDU76_013086 [Blyttiomyces sp. JEL0837]|nr:hypothetical protein HDU76_013086 [Blyttiomyces sp. JEL0837]